MDSDNKKISQLAEVTTMGDSDLFVVSIDVPAAPKTRFIKKINASPAPAKMAGDIVQVVHTSYATVMTGTTTVPLDDTIPTSSEGTAISGLDTAITPTSATNRLLVEVILFVNPDAINYMACSLFQDAGAAAKTTTIVTAGSGYYTEVVLRYEMAAGTTSATTFKIRCGGTNAGTVTYNGRAGARDLGGAIISSTRVTEIKV